MDCMVSPLWKLHLIEVSHAAFDSFLSREMLDSPRGTIDDRDVEAMPRGGDGECARTRARFQQPPSRRMVLEEVDPFLVDRAPLAHLVALTQSIEIAFVVVHGEFQGGAAARKPKTARATAIDLRVAEAHGLGDRC